MDGCIQNLLKGRSKHWKTALKVYQLLTLENSELAIAVKLPLYRQLMLTKLQCCRLTCGPKRGSLLTLQYPLIFIDIHIHITHPYQHRNQYWSCCQRSFIYFLALPQFYRKHCKDETSKDSRKHIVNCRWEKNWNHSVVPLRSYSSIQERSPCTDHKPSLARGCAKADSLAPSGAAALSKHKWGDATPPSGCHDRDRYPPPHVPGVWMGRSKGGRAYADTLLRPGCLPQLLFSLPRLHSLAL